MDEAESTLNLHVAYRRSSALNLGDTTCCKRPSLVVRLRRKASSREHAQLIAEPLAVVDDHALVAVMDSLKLLLP